MHSLDTVATRSALRAAIVAAAFVACGTSPGPAGSPDAGLSDGSGDAYSPFDWEIGDAFNICPPKAVNALGIGKPCQHNAECQGQPAVTCVAEAEEDGFPFCTKYCFFLKPDECGADATCIKRGDKPSFCAPSACASQLSQEPPPFVECSNPCNVGQVNDYGVGKVCTQHEDCQGFAVANVCPLAIRPENPNWCSVLCAGQDPNECGPNAFCWRRFVEEAGVKFVLGSCAPIACKK